MNKNKGEKMKLFTKEILNKLPTLDETAETGIDGLTVHLKLFNPTGIGTWYIYAYDPADDYAMAYVNLGDIQNAELGGVSLEELREFKGRFGLGIERDMHFKSMPLREVMDKVQRGEHV
jgi:hypothetical protein